MRCAWDGMRETGRSETVSFEQNPAQAPISGTSSSKQRHPTRRPPNPATETGARAPGPWCVIRVASLLASYVSNSVLRPSQTARNHKIALRPPWMRHKYIRLFITAHPSAPCLPVSLSRPDLGRLFCGRTCPRKHPARACIYVGSPVGRGVRISGRGC